VCYQMGYREESFQDQQEQQEAEVAAQEEAPAEPQPQDDPRRRLRVRNVSRILLNRRKNLSLCQSPIPSPSTTSPEYPQDY